MLLRSVWRFTFPFFLMAAGCERPQADGASVVSIQFPSASKLQSLSASSVDYSRLCFGVNVKGPGISTVPAASCDVERGLFEGAVATGSTLQVSVPVGSDRTFEIYGFLRDSASQECPQLSSSGWGQWPIRKIYLLGTKSQVQIDPPETNVEIKVSLPDPSQNIALARGWASSCLETPSTSSGVQGRLLIGSKKLTSSSFRLRARVADRSLGREMTGVNGLKFTGEKK